MNAFKAFKACVPVEWSPNLYVTLVRGLPGTRRLHRRTLAAMKLRKTNRTIMQRNTPSLRGMLQQVKSNHVEFFTGYAAVWWMWLAEIQLKGLFKSAVVVGQFYIGSSLITVFYHFHFLDKEISGTNPAKEVRTDIYCSKKTLFDKIKNKGLNTTDAYFGGGRSYKFQRLHHSSGPHEGLYFERIFSGRFKAGVSTSPSCPVSVASSSSCFCVFKHSNPSSASCPPLCSYHRQLVTTKVTGDSC
ncbi:hypothetical protein NE237_016727 [Protea cynaroides]|uniref:Large ribosomal subunit protein uL30m n=1 Tax=Protea cynaroides TaxID=273540 RepID=A0A9Q0K736_9MAGN|nr:hypothetical protein NE237_016727 [Protea cynaroides]